MARLSMRTSLVVLPQAGQRNATKPGLPAIGEMIATVSIPRRHFLQTV
jgi:hypothetical protein